MDQINNSNFNIFKINNVYNSTKSIYKSLDVNNGLDSSEYRFKRNKLHDSNIQDRATISFIAKQLNDLDKYLRDLSKTEYNIREITSPTTNNYIQSLINNYKSPYEIKSAYIYDLLNLYNKLIIMNTPL